MLGANLFNLFNLFNLQSSIFNHQFIAMRILTITPSFPPDYTGGAEVSIYHTSRGLIDQGVRCTILSISMRHPQRADEWYDLDGIHVHRVRFPTRQPGGEIFDRRVYRAVHREIDAQQPDVIHLHNASGASLAPYMAARRAGVPVVNTLHDHWLLCPNNMLLHADYTLCDPGAHANICGNCYRGYEYWGTVPKRRQLFARLTRNALFISPSQALIDLHVRGGYDPDRFRLVRLGFAEEALGEPTHPAVRRLQASRDRGPVIVFGGGGVDIKGSDVVLAAVPIILAQAPDAQIIVAGGITPEMTAAYRRYSPNVQVFGRVPFIDMRSLFALADLTLLPSIWLENSPVTIFESHQVGAPVVGSDIGGIPELIDHGRTGYIVPPGDPQALANAIVGHLNRPAVEQRRMRMACVETVRTQRSLAQHLTALRAVYDEAIGMGAQG